MPESQVTGSVAPILRLLRAEDWVVGERFRVAKLLIVSLLLLGLIVDYSRNTLAALSPGLLECLREPSRYAGIEVSLLYVPVVNGPQPHLGQDMESRSPASWGTGRGPQPRLLRTSLGFHELVGALPPMQEGTILSVRGRCTAEGTILVSQVLTHPLRPVKEQVSSMLVALLGGALAWRYLVPPSMLWLRRRRVTRAS